MKLIHYGSKSFIDEKFVPIKNVPLPIVNKPIGGLWTSPIDSKYGWKDWCKDSSFRTCEKENSFELNLSENSKICTIDCLSDLIKLLDKYNLKDISEQSRMFNMLIRIKLAECLDFESMTKDYDAVHLTTNGLSETHLSLPNLYGWDCESVLILNKECIVLDELAYLYEESPLT